ncbi:hypothetical protein OQI89_06730 [Lentilactobacillus diolivorans]|jgi:hypothetical protein|uniref:hypothetical protein n=1 Tax=Lentilactobacillus diolivorans TaxID=179838 RepID=UPI000FEE57FC|nr:hypothetical protein [Lentilactobacillus diolivorans]MDH5105543.1 hypothetical protein [Lentilactobacillus diolivorans]RRG03945.1 MAG: hypothetical protein DUD34_03405 [Lactobacillus sp.]
MSRLLENKIAHYLWVVKQHKQANKNYYHEILALVHCCDDRYQSIRKAPDNSPEMLALQRRRAQPPELHFPERTISDLPQWEALEVHQEAVELYYRGYDSATIGHILGLKTQICRNIIYEYQNQIDRDNKKVNS